MHIDITPIGDTLRSARKGKELSQAALAERIDVSIRTIIAAENNQRYPTYEVFCRLVHALDISADLMVYPNRALYTIEQEQFIHELMTCDEREQKIALDMLRSLIRSLRQDRPK